MIVVDTSALFTVLLREPGFETYRDILRAEPDLLLSAGTLAEALVVAAGRKVREGMAVLLDGYGFTIVPVTEPSARRAGDAYARWGKGLHPAGLNYGDCFAYELAKSRQCPLLFVGNDFAQTDVLPALG